MIVDGVLWSPVLAARYGVLVDRVVRQVFRQNGQPTPDELAEVLFELVEAGRDFRAKQQATAPGGSSGSVLDGSSVRVPVVDIGTSAVAEMLEITPRGVRDLASRGSLPGRRTPKGWVFDPVDVSEYQEARG